MNSGSQKSKFIVQFEVDFQEFYNYAIAVKYVMHYANFTNSCIISDASMNSLQ